MGFSDPYEEPGSEGGTPVCVCGHTEAVHSRRATPVPHTGGFDCSSMYINCSCTEWNPVIRTSDGRVYRFSPEHKSRRHPLELGIAKTASLMTKPKTRREGGTKKPSRELRDVETTYLDAWQCWVSGCDGEPETVVTVALMAPGKAKHLLVCKDHVWVTSAAASVKVAWRDESGDWWVALVDSARAGVEGSSL